MSGDEYFSDGSSANKKEKQLLYNLAKKCSGKGVIVEIGSWKGGSTVFLGRGSLDGAKVKIYAIDPHTGSPEHKKGNKKIWTFDEFKKNIKKGGVDKIVNPIVKTSAEAKRGWGNKKIELLWIDGNHDYSFVKEDIGLWLPLVVEGGTVAFHDTLAGGPKRAVKEFVYFGKEFKNIKAKSSIVYAKKTSKLSFYDKVRNLLSYCRRSFYIRTRNFYYLLKGIRIEE